MTRHFQHSVFFASGVLPARLKWLFAGHLLRGAAQQLVALFIPLSVYVQSQLFPALHMPWGSSLTKMQQGVLAVCLYYFVSRVMTLVLTIPATSFMRRLGLIKSMLVGNVLLVATYLMLYYSQSNPHLFLPAAMLSGLELVFYFVAYKSEFSASAKLSELDQEVHTLDFFEKVLRTGIPMLGGAIIALLNFTGLYLCAVVVMLAASLCLLFAGEMHFSSVSSWKEFWQWLKLSSFKTISAGIGGKYVDDASLTLWAVYLFLFLGTVERVGYVASLSLFLTLILSYLTGWYFMHKRTERTFYISSTLLSGLWIGRLFIKTTWHSIFVDFLDKVVGTVYVPLYDSHVFHHSRDTHVFRYWTYHYMVESLVAIVFWPLIALCFAIGQNWWAVFLIAGFGVLLSTSVATRKHVAGELNGTQKKSTR